MYKTLISATFMAANLWASALPAQANTSPSGQVLALEDAVRLAEQNEPIFAAAFAERKATALERKDALAGLLPSATYHNQYVFTQSDRSTATKTQGATTESLPVFIANNAVHEYASQVIVNETIGIASLAAVKLANANAARMDAEYEIARRGLLAAVVQLYYTVGATNEKLAVARRALEEASRFVDVTQKREAAGEAAHADVIKARLIEQQRQREVEDARLEKDKASLELGVLLYPDPTTNFVVAVETSPPVLADRKDVEAAAKAYSPELRSAIATLDAGRAQTLTAWAGLVPDVALNYTYGIDAPQFASYGPDGVRYRGYSVSATLDIPIWDWLTSERKVKEAKIREDASTVRVAATQRRLLANLKEFYQEAETAQHQLISLDASVTDAREALRLINLRYVNGEGTVLDVVDAQNTVIGAENARADGVARYHLALAQLQTLTGRP